MKKKLKFEKKENITKQLTKYGKMKKKIKI